MAHDVFISYSSKDKIIADAICANFESDGIRCWYAPRDIEPGAEWASSIVSAINQTKIMLLIFTDFANDSKQVLREVGYAADAGAVIIPFKLTEKEPSDGFSYYLKSIHWLDAINDELEASILQLRMRCRNILYGKNKTSDSGSEAEQIPVVLPQQESLKSSPKNTTVEAVKKAVGKLSLIVMGFFSVSFLLTAAILIASAFAPDLEGNYDSTGFIACMLLGIAALVPAFFLGRPVVRSFNKDSKKKKNG